MVFAISTVVHFTPTTILHFLYFTYPIFLQYFCLSVIHTLPLYFFAKGGDEDDEMMKEWFDLVCHKNKLLRQEADLVYM